MHSETPLLTPAQVAAILNVNPRRVNQLIKLGQLKAIRVSATTARPRYRVSRESLQEFMEGRMK